MSSNTPPSPGLGDLVAKRYRIDSVIGTGGMAVVYRATDEELGRSVALKVFRADVVDAASVQRQSDEIRLIASLDHPALVTLYDAVPGSEGDAHSTGVIVMQLVEGRDLRHRIAASGPLDSQTAAAIGADVAGALAYVHGRGVIHRDVSPANVLLPDRHEDGAPVARLADFGIARLIDSAGLTMTGTVIGTATYLSPEQAEGKPLEPSSDIYSLGLTLLEALTGDRAFPGTAIESATARLSSDPVIPGSLGESWATLLSAMTAREPSRRPSAAAVLSALRELSVSTEDPDAMTATKLLPAVAAGPIAATEVLPAATAVLPQGATEVLHRESVVSTPSTVGTGSSSRRPAVIVIAVIATAAIIAAIAFALAGGGAPASAPTEPEASAEASQEPVTEEPASPEEPSYPPVDGELGESLVELQRLVSFAVLEEDLATALQQQVLAATTSAAAGEFDTAKDLLEELRRSVDAARDSGTLTEAQSKELREAIDRAKRLVDDADDDKPGKGPKDND